MKEEPDEKPDQLFEEFSFWTKKAIESPEWKHLSIVLKNHRIYCEKQVHIYVRQRRFDNAFEWQVKADHANEILARIERRIKEVTDEINKRG